MGHVLLWIESLVLPLLLVAVWMAWVVRWTRAGRLGVVLIWGETLLLALLPLAGYAILAVVPRIHFARLISSNLFLALVALAVMYALGAAVVVSRGLRRRGEPLEMRAARWLRGRLAISFVVVAFVTALTLWGLDQAAKQQVAILANEASCLSLAVAPGRSADRENAAFVYREAIDRMGHWPEPEHASFGLPPELKPGESIPRTNDEKWTTWEATGDLGFKLDDPELRRFLKQQAPAFAMLRKGASMPECFFDRDFGCPGLGMGLPEVGSLQDGADRLALNALCRAADGDRRGAVEDIDAMFLIAEHVYGEPFLVSLCAGAHIDRRAIVTLQRVLASGGIGATDLSSLQIQSDLFYRARLKRSLKMDEATILSVIKDKSETGGPFFYALCYGDSPCMVPWRFPSLYRIFLLDDDVAAFKRLTPTLKFIDRDATYREIRDDAQVFDQRMQREPGGVLTAAIVPRVVGSLEIAAKADATRRVACVGVALCRYRAKNGRFPEKLDALTPEFLSAVPNDPFDDKPMKLERTDHGVIVYSVGPDMTDDDGKPLDDSGEKGDIGFECPDGKR